MFKSWPRKFVSVSSFAFAVAALLNICSFDLAQAGECAATEAKDAASSVSHIKNWKDLHAYYKAFGNCDDGEYADLVTGAVINLMTVHWSDLTSGADQILKDPKFSQFVLSHIDSTADTDDLKKIANNASKKCPMPLMLLCLEIKQVAKAAAK